MRLRGIKGYCILCLNMTSFGCLSQLLYYDLLDTVNYSALKQKCILLLIIEIRLMDEYLMTPRQAVKNNLGSFAITYQ